jgi:hypothetical protein
MEGRFAMAAPQIPADSPLEQVHHTLRPPRAARDTMAMEQLFFSGVSVAMLLVQAIGFVATYIFLAHTSEKALWPSPPPPPVMVEISR